MLRASPALWSSLRLAKDIRLRAPVKFAGSLQAWRSSFPGFFGVPVICWFAFKSTSHLCPSLLNIAGGWLLRTEFSRLFWKLASSSVLLMGTCRGRRKAGREEGRRRSVSSVSASGGGSSSNCVSNLPFPSPFEHTLLLGGHHSCYSVEIPRVRCDFLNPSWYNQKDPVV